MTENEINMLNKKAEANRAIRRKTALKKLAVLFTCVLLVMAALIGLHYIGFISGEFLVILVCGIAFSSTFRAGRIWATWVR